MNLLPPPGPARTRQIVALAVLVVAAAATGYVMFGGGTTESGASTSNRPATSAAPPSSTSPHPATGPAALPQALKFSQLDPVPDAPAAGRNLFRFGTPPPPPRPSTPPPAQSAPPPAPKPQGPPPPPPIPLKFLGTVDAAPLKSRVAMLRDATGHLLFGREGGIIDGRYRLVHIGLESVDLEYLDGRGRTRIAKGGS